MAAIHFTLSAPASPPTSSASSAAPTSSAAAPSTSAAPSAAATSGKISAWVWILIGVVVVVAADVVGLRLRRTRE
ncbi:hypothetical protein [Amycolatopsis sp. CA-128772]|uniref:hypothetical protein n=1 Tax=Amycolatopsis sp. CA-128772 TaxID=2073159 RepID=UPI001E3014A3|nr:hypothetical protein [Amycolatopsis sp. CA-128772]